MQIKKIVSQIKIITFNEALEYLAINAQKKSEKTLVVTINPEIIMLTKDDETYKKVVRSADLSLCDGVGVLIAGRIFGISFPGRIHGVDLLEKLSELASERSLTVGLLGGGKNVALKVSDCLKSKYPSLNIVFASEEWPGLEANQDEVSSSKYKLASKKVQNTKLLIPNTSIDILFVAFGSPKQEKWIYENLPIIDVKVAIGVGGAFDFISGKVRRAPIWVRRIGLEWLFRLIIQPWRIKRQLALPKFILLVLKERFIG